MSQRLNNQRLPAFLIAYSDSSFTNPHEVVLPDDPRECTGNFTHMGAKYWGFETSRHRATSLQADSNSFRFDDDAYHWFHIGLTNTAEVTRISVSTKWFTGNQVSEIAIELIDNHGIREVLPRTVLQPDSEHEFEIDATTASECLVRCFHEGGIARVNLFGNPLGESSVKINLLDKASISHVSNEHYGKPADAIKGNRDIDTMFGWESARTGFGEHALFQLSKPSVIQEVIVDTYLHRLNSPLSCHVFGLAESDETSIEHNWRLRPCWTIDFDDGLSVVPDNFQAYMQSKKYLEEPTETATSFTISLRNDSDTLWHPLVSFGRLRADTWHQFREIEYREAVSHILYMHYPNGGIHGLKIYGDEI